MSIMIKQALKDLDNADANIKTIYFFQGVEKSGDELAEILYSIDNKDLTEMFGFDTSKHPDTMSVIESLEDKGFLGSFIAEVETPVKTKRDDEGYGFSWGHTHYTLVVGKDFSELVIKTIEWARRMEKLDCKTV